jgi:predicted Zn-dependent protease
MATLTLRAFVAGTFLTAIGLLSSCETVPYTGRSRFINPLSAETEAQMGLDAFNDIKKQHPVSKDRANAAMIERVGKRIAAAIADEPVVKNGKFEWEFVLFESDTINAFCLPGGKVGFFTGILPICQDENGVAAVMGHEIAHAFVSHGAERVVTNYGVDLLLGFANAGLGTYEHKDKIMAGLGLGAQYGITLPYSRDQESEADELGLRFMMRAGFDPRAAITLWQRMAELGDGERPSECMSTHPDPLNRAKALEGWIPQIEADEARLRGEAGK